MTRTYKEDSSLYLTYVMGVLFTLHMVIPLYVNSSFLTQFVQESRVGLLYTIGSALTVIAILLTSRMLPRIGNVKMTLGIILLEAVAVFLLATSTIPLVIFIAFFLHLILTILIVFSLDIFVEAFSNNAETGRVRGMYLTVNNIAWVVGPVIAGFLAVGDNFSKVYLVSLVFLLPLAGVLVWYFKDFKDPVYHSLTPLRSLKHVWKIPDVRYIFLANLALRTFFAVMVVYTPLYLTSIGLTFDQIGVIFTVMLSAYILLEYPLGRLADTELGEKEILIAGFIVIVLTAAFLSFITTTSVVWWALALFMTRVGGAMVESMAETYFFKKTDESDTADLSMFRTTIPLGYVIAPLIVTPFLMFFSLQWIFVLAACIALPGIFFGLKIHDTL